MAITGVGNYGNGYFRPEPVRKDGETSGTKAEAEKNNEIGRNENVKPPDSSQKYLAKLQGKVSYVTLETGFYLNTKKDNKIGTVTINPKLLEKMQNDPEAEKKYTQLVKDIEKAEKTAAAYYNALGGCVERSSHWYIDENGKYCHFGYVYRDDKLNKKLREEAQKNAEEQIEKCRENNRRNAEKIAEKFAEKPEEHLEERPEKEKPEEIIKEKAEQQKAEQQKAEKQRAEQQEKQPEDTYYHHFNVSI